MMVFLLSLLTIIRRLGFDIWVEEPGYFYIRLVSKLTAWQRHYLRQNKPLIIRELEIEQRGRL